MQPDQTQLQNTISPQAEGEGDFLPQENLPQDDLQQNDLPQDDAEKGTSTNKKRRRKVIDIVLSVAIVVTLIVIVTVFLVRCFVVCRIAVSGDSMMPNFQNGQVVRVDKHRDREVKRGDVVVIYKYYVENKFFAELSLSNSENSRYAKLFKRVVALSGDKLWVEKQDNGEYLLVIQTPDGEILHEDYYTVFGKTAEFYDNAQFAQFFAKGSAEAGTVAYLGNKEKLGCLTNTSKERPFTVRENHFFFLGDNRHDSSDSRSETYADLPMHRIYGVVIED